MNKDNQEKIIAKEFVSSKPNETIRVPQMMRRNLLGLSNNQDNLIDMPITSFRVIFKILSDLKFYQFSPKNQIQFNLFEEEFKTQNNTYARMTFKISDISPGGKNAKEVKKGLAFLVNYKQGWHKSINSKGKEISVYGGLINDPSVSDGNISFLVSSYWLDQMLTLEFHNEALYNLAWALSSSKQMLFFLWLQELKPEGTSVNFQTINTHYKLNYSNAREIGREFFRPMKKAFDTNSNRSFNYSIKGDKLNIVPYDLPGTLIGLKNDTVDYLTTKAKTAYFKKRHSLTPTESAVMREALKVANQFNLIDASYKEVVKDYRKIKDKNITDLQGREFFEKLQAKIDDIYPVYRLSNDLPVKPRLI